MSDIAALLQQHNIHPPSFLPGRYYVICPQCSSKRKPRHQKLKCLGLRITDDGRAWWGCNHCHWTGPGKGARQNGEAEYYYSDDLRKVRRYHNGEKSFSWEHRNGNGDWEFGGGDPTLYRIDEIKEAIEFGDPIFVVEGEKNADDLWQLGFFATSAPNGATWSQGLSNQLVGANLVVLNDNNAVGYKYADTIVKLTLPLAKSIRRVDLKDDWPDIGDGEDVSDWLAKGRGSPLKLTDLATHAPIIFKTQAPTTAPLIKSSSEFVAAFTIPNYLIKRVLMHSYLYALTGQTGAGKTAITLLMASCVALGRPFAGLKTQPRRVLYLAAENPDDTRNRWIAMAQQNDFDVHAIEAYFIEGVFRISQMNAKLREECVRVGGDFGLVIIDTGPAFYEGEDQNSRVEMFKHARTMRDLIEVIPGRPTIVANMHPVKNAGPDNLIPAGGGSFLNEIDGNLTAAKSEAAVELHWLGKFRGAEFNPLNFELATVTHELLKDTDGDLIPTVVARFLSDDAKENMKAAAQENWKLVLAMIADNPAASYAAIAIRMGWEDQRWRAQRACQTLVSKKLAKRDALEKWEITPAGEDILAEFRHPKKTQ